MGCGVVLIDTRKRDKCENIAMVMVFLMASFDQHFKKGSTIVQNTEH